LTGFLAPSAVASFASDLTRFINIADRGDVDRDVGPV
jgi:hypothetical protein